MTLSQAHKFWRYETVNRCLKPSPTFQRGDVGFYDMFDFKRSKRHPPLRHFLTSLLQIEDEEDGQCMGNTTRILCRVFDYIYFLANPNIVTTWAFLTNLTTCFMSESKTDFVYHHIVCIYCDICISLYYNLLHDYWNSCENGCKWSVSRRLYLQLTNTTEVSYGME